jgi:hypothetical protein
MGEPGSILRQPGGAAVLYVDQALAGDEQRVRRLAETLRGAASVLILGEKPWCRQVDAALRRAWRALDRAARGLPPLGAPKGPPKPPAGRCGQPRRNGGPCGLPGGWGTDEPGTPGPCLHHGGSTAQRDAELRRAEEAAGTLARLRRTARQRPLTAVEEARERLAYLELARFVRQAEQRRR